MFFPEQVSFAYFTKYEHVEKGCHKFSLGTGGNVDFGEVI